MKLIPTAICAFAVIIGWNTLAVLRDNGKLIDTEYRAVHQLYCIKHPNHHHCK
jgi:hypothetical protein